MKFARLQQTESKSGVTKFPSDSSVAPAHGTSVVTRRGLRLRRSSSSTPSDRSSFWQSVRQTVTVPTKLSAFPPTTGLLIGRIPSQTTSSPTSSPGNEAFSTPFPTASPVPSGGSLIAIPAVVGVAMICVCCVGLLIWWERKKVSQDAARQERARNRRTAGDRENTQPQLNSPELVGGMAPEERWRFLKSHLSSIIVQTSRNSMSKSIRASQPSESHGIRSKRMSSLFGRSGQNVPLCAICLVEYKDGDKMCESNNPNCKHQFHKECMTSWLAKHEECPCCRQKFLIVGDQGEQEEEKEDSSE